jgi:CDP-diacylglycerol pyrophosphatase
MGLGVLVVFALAGSAARPAHSAHPNALWRVVHDLCVTDMKLSGAPAPCLAVDLTGRTAVIKDMRGATQVLLIPTDRASGIESPRLLEPSAPNYWQAAWDARRFFERRAGRAVPRQEVAMAINSAFARSQNQLHIHIDCVRPDVIGALEANQARIGLRWSNLAVHLVGQPYRVRRLMGAELAPRDPFKLLALGDPRAGADMARETLAVVGFTFAGDRPGFILLSGRTDILRGDQGAGEEILDHDCKVLRLPVAPASSPTPKRP